MPGSNHPACPKGEVWDKKIKACVKNTLKKPKVPGSSIKRSKDKKKRVAKYTIKKASPNKQKTPSPKKNETRSLSGRKSTSASPVKIPYLSNIKDTIGEHQVDYFKDLLKNILNSLDSQKTRLKNNTSLHYILLDEILEPVEEDIQNIDKKHKIIPIYFGEKKRTETYHFAKDNVRKVVLKQLHDYVKYFKKIADKEGRVDINKIYKLYD